MKKSRSQEVKKSRRQRGANGIQTRAFFLSLSLSLERQFGGGGGRLRFERRAKETKAVGVLVLSLTNVKRFSVYKGTQNVAFVFATFTRFEETKTHRRAKRRTRRARRTFLKMSTLGPRLHAIALKALEFPRILSPGFTKDVCVASLYNSETSREYRELVLWLENTKIRKLKREGGGREKLLRETLEDEAWSKNYEEYLKVCECDETHLTCAESKIDFLINLALAEEYRDRFDIAAAEEEEEEEEGEDAADDDNEREQERARTPTEKMRGMGIDKDDGGENTREDVMIDANVENVGSAEKRTKVENEKGFAYSRFKPKEGETEGEGKGRRTDAVLPLDSSLLADLRDVQDDMDDEETYDALMKVLNTFDVVPAFETNRPTVDARLVRLATKTLERFVVPFQEEEVEEEKEEEAENDDMENDEPSWKLDLKLSDEDYVLRDSGVPMKNPKVKRMVDALRVLYVNQLRVTQDRADDILLQVQSRVADPRTDAKQGRVGR